MPWFRGTTPRSFILTALLPKIQGNLDKFVVPDGTLTITEPGTYDVTEYEKAVIQIPNNDYILTLIEEGQDAI